MPHSSYRVEAHMLLVPVRLQPVLRGILKFAITHIQLFLLSVINIDITT